MDGSRFKALIFWSILFVMIAITLEAVAFTSFFFMRSIYNDGREELLEKLNAKDLARFRKREGHPVTGWTRRGPRKGKSKNCRGVTIGYSWDERGARTYNGYDKDAVSIVILGDSYTNGSEAKNDEAYPAVLAKSLNLSAANHGVGAFGPVQGFLHLKQVIGFYPNAKVVVLGIMYENIYRMLNSYRPVLSRDTGKTYGLKPFISEGRIEPHPGEVVFQDVNVFRDHAQSAFEHDFWAPPRHDFPYLMSFIRALVSNHMRFHGLRGGLRKLGVPEFFMAVRSETVVSNLVSLLNLFTAFVAEQGMKPVVLFIPRSKYDTRSIDEFREASRNRLDPSLLVLDVGQAEIEWDRYNLGEDGSSCHPSPYGYRMIAEHLAVALRREGLVRTGSD